MSWGGTGGAPPAACQRSLLTGRSHPQAQARATAATSCLTWFPRRGLEGQVLTGSPSLLPRKPFRRAAPNAPSPIHSLCCPSSWHLRVAPCCPSPSGTQRLPILLGQVGLSDPFSGLKLPAAQQGQWTEQAP